MASQRCATCHHSECLRIEKLHAAGMTFERLGERFSLHPMAIFRHWKNHVSDERKASFVLGPEQIKDLCETVAQEDGSRLDYLKLLRRHLITAVEKEQAAGRTLAMAAAARELRRVLDDIAMINGEVWRRHQAVNLTVNQTILDDPRFAMMQAGLIDIGRSVPEAMPKIIALVERIDAGPPMIEGSTNG